MKYNLSEPGFSELSRVLRALEIHTKYLYKKRRLHFCHKLRSVSHEILAAEAVAESKGTGKHLCDLQTH